MLTRALLALTLICGLAAAASAEDAKVIALGLTDHEATKAEIESGSGLLAPHFNTGGVAYVLAANLKKGDIVEIALVHGEAPLLQNMESSLLRTRRGSCCKRENAAFRRAAGLKEATTRW